MLSDMGTGRDFWWYNALWKWFIPLKVKLLCWLMMENKILTWDKYLKRGGFGPNVCIL